MIKTRMSVFETNSSSTHSISIETAQSMDLLQTICPNDSGTIYLYGGEFGWEPETFTDAETKANYCATDMQSDREKLEMLSEVIKDHTGAKAVIFDLKDAYVDHQSAGTSYEAFASKKTLRDFIFNPKSTLHTDNDNY